MQLERYRIETEIGRGAMATVYKAYDTRADRWVALKLLHRHFVDDDVIRTRFVQEAKTIALLRHRAIIPILHAAQVGKDLFLVMPLMAGGNLTDRLRRGPLTLVESLSILERIASALDYAHSQGIIHRDVKPDNILFDEAGQAYLGDFGVVKLLDTNLTQTGTGLIGTPTYMSPEQIQGVGNLDGRTDIYALGVVLFEMLSGHAPFDGESEMAVAMKHLNEPVPDVRDYVKTLSPAWQGIIHKAMAKKPADRYPTGAAMLAAVDALGRSNRASDRAAEKISGVSGVAHDRSVQRWLLAIAGLLALGGIAFLGLRQISARPETTTITPPATAVVIVEPATSTIDVAVIINATLTAVAPTSGPTETVEITPAIKESVVLAEKTVKPPTLAPPATATSTQETTPAVTRVTATPRSTTAGSTTDSSTTATPTLAPASPDTGSATVLDFENFGQWTRGDETNGTLTQSSEQVHSGGRSSRLDYQFSTNDNDYVVFLQERPISGTPNALRVWVYGDGSAHYLNAWIIDNEGQTWQVPFGQVLHTGWKQMTAYIDTGLRWPWGHISGPDNQTVDYPIRFRGLVFDDFAPEYQGEGTVFLDGLTTATVPASEITSVVPVIPRLTRAPEATGEPGESATPGSEQAAGQPDDIVFMMDDELYTTGADSLSPRELSGFRPYSCELQLTSVDGQTFSLYEGPVCGIGATGTGVCRSPNGQYEVVTSSVTEGTAIVVRQAGSESNQFVFQGGVDQTEGIRWSPLSDSFLFVGGDTAYRARPDGSYAEVAPIAYGPQFSPNGNLILYTKPVGPGVVDLFVSNADGTQPRNVTNSAVEQIRCPRWRVP